MRQLAGSNNGTTFSRMPTDPAAISPRQLAELRRLLGRREKKAKTSISLSGELLEATDALAGKSERSAFVERALRRYLNAIVRRARHQHDLEVIDANAAASNKESDTLLDMQAWPG